MEMGDSRQRFSCCQLLGRGTLASYQHLRESFQSSLQTCSVGWAALMLSLAVAQGCALSIGISCRSHGFLKAVHPSPNGCKANGWKVAGQ